MSLILLFNFLGDEPEIITGRTQRKILNVNLFGCSAVINFEALILKLKMEKIKRNIQAATLVLLPLFLTACGSVNIVENVKNPSRYFKKAYCQIERIHEQYPNREGKPHSIHVLIYEESENKLIRVSAPFWMVNACLDLGMWAAERGENFDFEDQYDFDWREIRELDQIGLGLLVEVDDEENKILIWLE